MGMWHWNPQIDQLINNFDFEDAEIRELMEVAPDCFDDPDFNPVWFEQIKYRLPKELRKKIEGFQKDHEIDMFGWQLS